MTRDEAYDELINRLTSIPEQGLVSAYQTLSVLESDPVLVLTALGAEQHPTKKVWEPVVDDVVTWELWRWPRSVSVPEGTE